MKNLYKVLTHLIGTCNEKLLDYIINFFKKIEHIVIFIQHRGALHGIHRHYKNNDNNVCIP